MKLIDMLIAYESYHNLSHDEAHQTTMNSFEVYKPTCPHGCWNFDWPKSGSSTTPHRCNTVIKADMLNVSRMIQYAMRNVYPCSIHIQLMSNIETILHAAILLEYWELKDLINKE